MEHERFRDLALQHLLPGLTGAEQTEFEAELERRGADGWAELDRMREAIASLALSSPAVPPPPDLRRRLVEEVERGAADGGVSEAAPIVTALRRRPLKPIVTATAAAMIALLLGVVWNVQLGERLRETERELTRARLALVGAGTDTIEEPRKTPADTFTSEPGDLASTQRALAAAQSEIAQLRQRLAMADSAVAATAVYQRDLEALVRPEGKVLNLAGTDEQPAASARVFVNPSTGRVLLFVYDLPVLAPGAIYQLWAIRGATPTAAGTFSTGPGGTARVELKSGAILERADALAVTIEPAPGGPAPTGKMVLRSS